MKLFSQNRAKRLSTFAAVFLILSLTKISFAADWPMWRFDAGRTASAPDPLPAQLTLRWTRKYAPRVQTWDDTLNNDLMQYDKVFEPIVLGNRIIVGFNDSDKVVCWDVASGEEIWRFYTDGPVRMPPAGAENRVFVTSDDGHLYCLDVHDGSLLWKFRGGPGPRKVLGNQRVVSMWPARGGPVVRDGHVYFAASIWPFMGTFLYDLDVATGAVMWVNDGTSASYIKQPHSANAFAGIAPQGALVATSDALIVPGGRSIPAVFDRQTGELNHFHLNAGGKGTGGSFVMSTDEHFYVHTRQREVRRMDLHGGLKTALMLNEPVLDGWYLITSDENSVKSIESNDNGTIQKTVWELPVDGRGDLIRAGRRVYAAGEKSIAVIELADDSLSAEVVSQLPVENVARLVAGGDSLLAVTLDGGIHCFGKDAAPSSGSKVIDGDESTRQLPVDETAAAFLQQHEATSGYAIVYGVENHEVLDQLLAGSDLNIVGVSEHESVVQQLRIRYDDMGVYGTRITLHVGTPAEFQAPPYIAHLVAVAASDVAEYLQPQTLAAMYHSVRPYGGLLWFAQSADRQLIASAVENAALPKAVLADDASYLKRTGSLEGAAPWTHLYGNVANTVKSDDRLVKAPLGLLWFGGNTHHDVLPRHSHSPGEQVLGGRLFVEGMNSLTARDVYTGRTLWRREFESLGTEGIYFDKTYHDTPLSTQYNQVHIPGANARGTNFVASTDGIYLVIGDKCHVLDPSTGETSSTITLPKEVNPHGTATWTYIGVYGDMLIAGVDFANQQDASALFKSVETLLKRGTAWSPQWFASRRIAVLDRHSGDLLWHADAKYSFLHNGIIAGGQHIFLLDKLPGSIEEQKTRRGMEKPTDYRVAARDAKTGDIVWETTDNVFGTWLAYSEAHDTLVHAGAAAPDRSMDEVKAGIVAFQGRTGEPLWQNLGFEFSGPCIIHNDKIIMNSRSYALTSGVVSIHDGTPVLIENPLTGEEKPWTYQRTYGCNTAVASEHLLTFRSGAAGYYDLDMQCGVANLGGFRSGCTSNLIAADGVLNAPDFTRTCSCGYQNQTSLALVHMPDVEVWTSNPFERAKADGAIKKLGINFGAAGTRRAQDGTVWIEYPPESQDEFPIELKVEGKHVRYARRHSSTQSGDLAWVNASNVQGFSAMTLTTSDRDGEEPTPERFTVRLHFADPVSDDRLLVQGESPQVQPSSRTERSSTDTADIKVFSGIESVAGKIRIQLQHDDASSAPALTGIQLIAE